MRRPAAAGLLRQPLVAVALLAMGAGAFGLLAWRETLRAHGTAELLVGDYASFIADRFVVSLAADPRLSPDAADGVSASPFSRLLRHAQEARERPGPGLAVPEPISPLTRYFFSYDRARGALSFAGRAPAADERAELEGLLSRYSPACGSDRLVPFRNLGVGARTRDDPPPRLEWAGWVETDALGDPRRVHGLRLDGAAVVEGVAVPLVENDSCGCPPTLLPESLSAIESHRDAATFVIRDADRRAVYVSQPDHRTPDTVSRERSLGSAAPLPGWSVEVTLNPAVLRPLLPYGGRDVPWAATSLLVLLVAGAGGLAVRSLRRQAELVEMQRDFVGNVSHELKTPLTRIRLFNELAAVEQNVDAPKRRRYRRIIDRECRRLGMLVDNVLAFASGRRERPMRMERLDLRAVVDEALDAFRSAADPERYQLHDQLDDVPAVRGDRAALQRVLVNLVDNAVKYSPEGGLVEVRLRAEGDRAELSVADRGPGIPEAEAHRVFEPFYRLDGGDSAGTSGNGLGLALVKSAAEAHGGDVRVEVREGRGARFTVTLPLAGPAGSPA